MRAREAICVYIALCSLSCVITNLLDDQLEIRLRVNGSMCYRCAVIDARRAISPASLAFCLN